MSGQTGAIVLKFAEAFGMQQVAIGVHKVTGTRVGDRWIRVWGSLIALAPAAKLAVRAVCKMRPGNDRHESRLNTTKYDIFDVF